MTYRAVNAVVDKARVVVAEDLSRTFTVTIVDRAADADIGLYTPHWRVKQIIGG